MDEINTSNISHQKILSILMLLIGIILDGNIFLLYMILKKLGPVMYKGFDVEIFNIIISKSNEIGCIYIFGIGFIGIITFFFHSNRRNSLLLLVYWIVIMTILMSLMIVFIISHQNIMLFQWEGSL